MNDWDSFLSEATAVFVAKNTDYDSRFMRALLQYQEQRGIEAARTIWAWEVEKKLDRCRTWIKRGELQVKDEGVRNSVIDLFNYTVQYRIYQAAYTSPLELLNERDFYKMAALLSADSWLHYLANVEKLIAPEETELYALLLNEMTGVPF